MQPQLAQWLSNWLPYDLVQRFRQIGRLEILEEAITLNREWLQILPATHPDQLIFLNHLGEALHLRFEQSGHYKDLEEAISLNRDALELYPPLHPLRSNILSDLGNALRKQFLQSEIGRAHV